MARSFHLFFYCLFVSVLLPMAASGQVRLRVLVPYGLNEELYIDTGGDWEKLKYDEHRRGSALTIDSGSSLVLARQVAPMHGGEGARPEYKEVARAELPKGASELLAIIAPKPGGGYSAVALDDSAEGFPAGQLRFVNLARDHIVVQIDKARDDLDYLGRIEVSLDELASQRVIVMAATENDGEYHLAYSQRRTLRSNLRYLLIATAGEFGEVKVRWLRDRPAARP